jgi:hypothetical protein
LPFIADIHKNGHMAVPPWPDATALDLTWRHTYRRGHQGHSHREGEKGPDIVAAPAARARRATHSGQWVMSATCSHCGGEFKPLRRSARFCGSTCRVAAHRRIGCNAKGRPEKPAEAPVGFQNGSGAPPPSPASKNAPAPTTCLSVTRPHAIIPDGQWPGMYRIKRRDGSVTDMVNSTRAKEALL